MSSIADLQRRMSRKIEAGKTIQLSPDDLDLLVASGAYAAILRATEEYQRDQCLQRSARSRSTSGDNTPSIAAPIGKTSKSSGTTANDDAKEALALAQVMLPKASLRSIGNT